MKAFQILYAENLRMRAILFHHGIAFVGLNDEGEEHASPADNS